MSIQDRERTLKVNWNNVQRWSGHTGTLVSPADLEAGLLGLLGIIEASDAIAASGRTEFGNFDVELDLINNLESTIDDFVIWANEICSWEEWGED